MIKSEVRETPTEKKRNYPYLGIFKTADVIVLFERERTGVCVGGEGKKLAMHSSCWVEADFEPLQGQVILSNE